MTITTITSDVENLEFNSRQFNKNHCNQKHCGMETAQGKHQTRIIQILFSEQLRSTFGSESARCRAKYRKYMTICITQLLFDNEPHNFESNKRK